MGYRYASCGIYICKNTCRSFLPASAGRKSVPANRDGSLCQAKSATTTVQPVQQIFQIHLINSRFPHVFFPLFFHRLVTFPAFFFFSIAVLSVTITIFSVAITAIGAVSVACRTLRHAVQYIAADRNLRIPVPAVLHGPW